jgi:biotin carboxyl carrier protein
MSDGRNGAGSRNGGAPSVVPDKHPPDPRGVRVTALGFEEGVEPVVIEPAAVPLGPVPRSAGQGVLGGVAPAAPAPLGEVSNVGLTVNGSPLGTTFERTGDDRGILRVEAGAGDGAQESAHRLLLIEDGSAGGAARGVVRHEVVVDGWRIEVEVESAARAALRERARRGREAAGKTGPTDVHAIIPGVVVAVSVAPGDQVEAGQQLLVVEAMKMQNELRAPREGTIERVAVGTGSTIEVGDLLLVIS